MKKPKKPATVNPPAKAEQPLQQPSPETAEQPGGAADPQPGPGLHTIWQH